jgi:hypothetical protein
MTVGANDPEVGQAVVVSFPVHVIELERDRSTVPSIEATDLTLVSLETFRDEPPLEPVRLARSSVYQQRRERHRGPDGHTHPLPPSLPDEVRRIDAEIPDASTQSGLAPASPDAKVGQDLREGARSGNRVSDLVVFA